MAMMDEAINSRKKNSSAPQKVAELPKGSHAKPPAENEEAVIVDGSPSDKQKQSKGDKLSVAIASAVVVICGIILAVYYYQIAEAKKLNVDIKKMFRAADGLSITTSVSEPDMGNEEAVSEAVPAETSVSAAEEEPVAETEPLPPLIELEYATELKAINPDAAGYVRIPGVLEEPVVQYSDNEYYLEHNLYNSKRQCGTVFADFRDVVNDHSVNQSDNIVLYGHNQADGTMFGNMDYYRWSPNYWLKNPFIYFNNNYEEYTYVIVASFVTNTLPEHDDGNVFDYWDYINFNSSFPFDYFKSEIEKRSTFITGVDINEDDKFLTLSTCSTEWEPSRHAIIARRLRDGETKMNIDTTEFEVNPNPKWPAIYYKYNGGSYTEQE